MTITRNLNWFPAFANEICIEMGDFEIVMKSDTTEIEIEYYEECNGYMGASGKGIISIDFKLLAELRVELDNSIMVVES